MKHVLVVDPIISRGITLATALNASTGASAAAVTRLSVDDVTRDGPDLALIHQDLATTGALAFIRRCGPDGVQSIVMLSHRGPPPPALTGLADSFIWHDVGTEALVRFVVRALGRHSSLIRMRAVRKAT